MRDRRDRTGDQVDQRHRDRVDRGPASARPARRHVRHASHIAARRSSARAARSPPASSTSKLARVALVAALVDEDRLEQRLGARIAALAEVAGVELELLAAAALAAMDEREEPALAEPLEQILGVGERRRERRALLVQPQLGRRAARTSARGGSRRARAAGTARAARSDGGALRGQQQIDPAGLLGAREARSSLRAPWPGTRHTIGVDEPKQRRRSVIVGSPEAVQCTRSCRRGSTGRVGRAVRPHARSSIAPRARRRSALRARPVIALHEASSAAPSREHVNSSSRDVPRSPPNTAASNRRSRARPASGTSSASIAVPRIARGLRRP